MAHNLSDRRARELIQAAAAEARSGWVKRHGKWEAPATAGGLRARGSQLQGFCSRDDCRRRVAVDAAWWCEHGFTELKLSTIREAYRCGLVACGLAWRAEAYPRGLALGCYLDQADVAILIACSFCRGDPQSFTVEAFVERIARSGLGSAATPAVEISGRLVRGDCKVCGRRAWSVAMRPAPAGPQR